MRLREGETESGEAERGQDGGRVRWGGGQVRQRERRGIRLGEVRRRAGETERRGDGERGDGQRETERGDVEGKLERGEAG